MRIILNDSCCLIDLRKVGLLTKALGLPYRMAVVYPLRVQELLGIPEHEWALLEDSGLEVIDVSGDLVAEAEQAKRLVRGPSFIDCLSFVQARAYGSESVLLTNNRKLRELALLNGVEVHGTLWLLDELQRHTLLSAVEVADVLMAWYADPLVFLPKAEVQQRLLRFTTTCSEAGTPPQP